MSAFSHFRAAIRKAVVPSHAVILTYHSAVDVSAGFPVWQHMTTERMASQFEWLAGNRECISLSAMVDGLKSGRLQDGAVAVTFDDGFVNNLHNALPLLEKFGIPATFFIPAGLIGSRRMMWTESLVCILDGARNQKVTVGGSEHDLNSGTLKAGAYRAIVRFLKPLAAVERERAINDIAIEAGLDPDALHTTRLGSQLRMMSWEELNRLSESQLATIGAHTLHHPRLTSVPDAEAALEINGSKELLEQKIGKVDHFAYPFGGKDDYADRHRSMAVQAAYAAAFSASPDSVYAHTDPFSIPRLGIGGGMQLHELQYALTGGLAWLNGARLWRKSSADS